MRSRTGLVSSPSFRKDAFTSSPRLLIASLNPSSELFVLSMVTVAEAEPEVTFTRPFSNSEVVLANPFEIILVS